MAAISTARKVFFALTMVLSFAEFVLCIDYIADAQKYLGTYPPAAVALLVAALLHTIYYFYLIVAGGRHRASTILMGILFVWTFYLASLIAFTVLRNKPRYCPPGAYRDTQCAGTNRGVMAVGWTNIGIGLFAVGTLAGVVSRFGKWSDQLHDLPPRQRLGTQDVEKAPAH